MTTPDTDNDSDYAGMTLTEVYAKHKRLRGTDALKYPPERHSRCKTECGANDQVDGDYGNRRVSSHRCFLWPHAEGDCEFSSECVSMHREERTQ